MESTNRIHTARSSSPSNDSSSNNISNSNSSTSDYLTSMQKNLRNIKDKKMNHFESLMRQWKGRKDFLYAQAQMVGILLIAFLGNNWPYSYHRNGNHSPTMFYLANAGLLVAAYMTLKHEPSTRGVQLLSRAQTEEWKGWMQWAFVMYHYYRMYAVYNEIRVFVSAYVWMTGFGNFLYFDKKGDFTVERAVSMWLRINYFPLLLSTCLRVPLELYYVVPLHTTGFFITMATCYVAKCIEQHQQNASSPLHGYVTRYLQPTRWNANVMAIGICTLVHILFYETPICSILKIFSDEYYFRFTSDRYSALIGIVSGLFWDKFKSYIQWAYNAPSTDATATTSPSSSTNDKGKEQDTADSEKAADGVKSSQSDDKPPESSTNVVTAMSFKSNKVNAMYIQRAAGAGLMLFWYGAFGRISDKYTYNPIHPYVFWMPVAGWLMVRNSSKYLCELHAGALEWLGRITLETYVLQFHIFMCKDVQHIPVIVPGAGQDGFIILRTLNMLIWGSLFLFLSFHARQITVTTQTTVTDLVTMMRKGLANDSGNDKDDEEKQEMLSLTALDDDGDNNVITKDDESKEVK